MTTMEQANALPSPATNGGARPIGAGSGWHCPACRRPNPPFARFCGGCGRSLDQATVAHPPGRERAISSPLALPIVPYSESATGEVETGPLPMGISAPFQLDDGPPSEPDPALGEREFRAARQQGSLRRRLQIFARRKKPALTLLLIGLLVMGALPLAILAGLSHSAETTTPNPDGVVRWSELQSFLSRHLAITLIEANLLVAEALGKVPAADTPMQCEQLRAVEAVLNSAEDSEPLTLSKDLPLRGPLLTRHLEVPPPQREVRRFDDVPLDHPLYLAWEPLLETGCPLAATGRLAQPYEPLTWEAWDRVLSHLVAKKKLSPPGDHLPAARSGIMNSADLREALRLAAEWLGRALPEESFRTVPPFIPNRLEGLEALAWLMGPTTGGLPE